MNNTFQKLKDRAEEFGVPREALHKAIKESNGDIGKILKFLVDKKPNSLLEGKQTEKFTSDRLFGEPEKSNRGNTTLSEFNTSLKSNTGDVFQTVPTRKRYSQKRQLKPGSDLFRSNVENRRELQSKISDIKQTMAHERDEPFLFPSTEFDFDLQDVVKTSIANYKKAKRKWDPSTSSIRNQFF